MLDNKTLLNQYECRDQLAPEQGDPLRAVLHLRADCKRSADIDYNHSTLKSLFTLHLYTVDGLIAIMYRPSFTCIMQFQAFHMTMNN